VSIAVRKIRPPVKRHGGKAYHARRIVALMPPHRTYLEPFVGGGSVLLNKPRVEIEIASDLDSALIGMWSQLSRNPAAVIDDLSRIKYTEAEFREVLAYFASPHQPSSAADSPSSAASAYIVRSRFSRGGLGKSFAWSDRLRGGQPGDVNAWDTFRRVDLPAICERARGVRFECCEAVEMIRRNGSRDALIYADPPYLHETRTARKAYEHEMTAAQHADLLSALVETPAKVILSGYRSRMYDGSLADWRRVDVDMPNHSGQGKAKQRRIECLWMNY